MKRKHVKDFLGSKSNLIRYAITEFKRIGWMDENCDFPEPDESEKEIFGMNMQEVMCAHILELLSVFSDEGHSGISAPYALNIFNRLANFQPLGPIEDKPEYWEEVSKDLFQHKHCSRIFKDAAGNAWDVEGRVFYRIEEDGNKNYYNNVHCRKDVTFPYHVPERTEYVNEEEYRAQHPEEYLDEGIEIEGIEDSTDVEQVDVHQ